MPTHHISYLIAFLIDRAEKFRFKINMYKLKEEREIEPKTLAHLVSSTLYERR
jgi:20S proteasome subunit beta 3